ncbi:hypothetical protein RJ40_00635 [Methanofollis aquaemaris]|uniref:Uncharacterized protein n=1 Tax=Methanofollis aquaemaris TaxID=126734 RepID=A0A8A3S1J4_9EURY|nr:hypothetical protein [Methanofollis aquaemaris]QSZ66112.1 hypothetical protein RJ40_00635 [Methanofollis aquaemaris]
MTTKAAVLWDQPGTFNRYVDECCGICCEHLTQHLIAAPFFRGRYVALVIPTGFANQAYSRLLPGLRAASGRIERFVENGGRLLVFGAADERPGAYDWLPFEVEYRFEFGQRSLGFADGEERYAPILDGYDLAAVETDGFFPAHEGEVVAGTPEGQAVIIRKDIGDGEILVTSTHEYPSAKFMGTFCTAERETLF